MVFKLLEGDTITPDGDVAKTYGVAVFPNDDCKASEADRLYLNDDITFDKEEMLRHVYLWNEHQPSLQQLKDLIADLIEANYNMP